MRIEYKNGNVQYYEGMRDQERIVRKVLPNNSVTYYEGEKGQERVVRIEYPDGTIRYYKGEKGKERLVRTAKKRKVAEANGVSEVNQNLDEQCM